MHPLLPVILAPLLTAGLTYVVGNRLSAQWALRQKQREMELVGIAEFQKLYGEFFATWKLWQFLAERDGAEAEAARWELMKRAAAAEGQIESMMVRIATGRVLTSTDIEVLGKFRQAYKQVRRAIRDGYRLQWYSSENPEYLAFKQLASATAFLLSRTPAAKPTPEEAHNAIREITSNRWHHNWVEGTAYEISRPDERASLPGARAVDPDTFADL